MPASFIKIGGQLIDNAILEWVEVTQALNEHWHCRVECRQTEDIRIAVEDSLGQDLQIVTVDQQGAQHTVFAGFVLEATVVYEAFGSYTARFTGITRSYKLDLTEQEIYFRKKTLKDVASALAGEDGLNADVKCQSKPAKNYVQWGESDFQFLKRMAYEHKAWIRPTAQGIEICDSFQGGSQLAWRQEGSLLEFDMEGRIGQPSFSGTHYDARKMTSTAFQEVKTDAQFSGASGPMVDAVKSGSQSALSAGYLHLDSRTATPDEYQDALERESIRSIGGGLVGHGFSQNSALMAGDSLDISGPLDASGAYGITTVIHRWNRQRYKNEFWCTPWTNYVNPAGLTHRKMPGVVPARVVAHNDPRKMGRVQVQYDWQGSGQTGWARMTSPHTGAERGLMFMPEQGDEVLVGFEQGDAERPFILGALWNGVDSAPREDFWGSDVDPNDVKRIVTKSGHRIQLSDKQGKESIVIATPNTLKISMIEKADETGRSMILLHSADGDIYFTAPDGRVHFQSQSLSTEITAGSNTERKTGPSPKGAPKPAPAAGASPAAKLQQWQNKHAKDINAAVKNQAKMLAAKKAQLDKWDPATQKQFKKWFGKTDTASRKLIEDRIDKEIALNKSLTIDHFHPPEPGQHEDGQFAYVHGDDKAHNIYLDDEFNNAPATGTNSKAGTLSHEISHFNDIGGTDDHRYGPSDCKTLAKKNPADALNNADSFEYFMEDAK